MESKKAQVTLKDWCAAFITDRRAQRLSPETQEFYEKHLTKFTRHCTAAGLELVTDIAPDTLRGFLLDLEGKHSAGGIAGIYRAVRAFLLWYAEEDAPPEWKNPIERVKPPRVPDNILPPVSDEVVRALLGTCDRGTMTGARDYAAFLFLLDTGARANEFCALNVSDVELPEGVARIRRGKGGKARTVFFGTAARRALRAYLKMKPEGAAVWVKSTGERLTYDGLRHMVERRAAIAGVDAPPLHAFRRAFALSLLRAGVDLLTVARLLGHSNLATVSRYLKLGDVELEAAFKRASPVDALF